MTSQIPDLSSLFQPRMVDKYMLHVPHPKQQLALSLNNRELLFGGAAGGGKSDWMIMAALQYALALDTKVPTPSGWSTIGQLSVGDIVYAPDGTETTVTATTEVYEGDCYSLTFGTGQKIIADGDHLWFASDFKDRLTQSPNYNGIARNGQIVSTRQMFETQTTAHKRAKANWSVSRTMPIQGIERELPLDPYLFGLWLGDGSKRDGTISGTSDDNVRQAFIDRGFVCTDYKDSHFHVAGLRPILTKLGVRNNKHIPIEYLRASYDQRLELLRGLMDSDGTVTKRYGSCRFFNTNKRIIDGFCEIAHSLGLNPTYTRQSYKRSKDENGFGWVVDFTSDVRVFNLERKYCYQVLKPTRDVMIRSIEKVESTPVKCITVDHPTHLFLVTESYLPTHNCDVPGYSALILRRSWPDLNNPNAILARFTEWMAPHTNAKEVHKGEGGRIWTFPSGAKIQFGYASRPAEKIKFQGSEYQFVGFDEATQFEPELYEYLLSRMRRPQISCLICQTPLQRYFVGDQTRYRHSNKVDCEHALPDPAVMSQYGPAPDGTTIFDVPLRLRATANPGGLSHEYFKERFVLGLHKYPDGSPVDAAFIPSTLADNPSLDQAEYIKTLEGMGVVDRERLLNGDWEVQETGNLFNRGDFNFVDEIPDDKYIVSRARFWDFAASDGARSDYTVGALCSIGSDGKWYIEDIKRVKYLPPEVERLVRKTAIEDGISIRVYSEQEPGSAGKSMVSHITRNVLPGFQYKGIRSSGSKIDRAGALVSQVAAHNVFVKKSDWNVKMLDEFTLFPAGLHDDQVDAVAACFVELAGLHGKRRVRIIV